MEFKHFIFLAWKVMEFNSLSLKVIKFCLIAVPDSDLERSGGGGGHPDP